MGPGRASPRLASPQWARAWARDQLLPLLLRRAANGGGARSTQAGIWSASGNESLLCTLVET